MVKKKTTEEFKKEVYDLVGDEYEVLGEYIGSKTPIKIKHNVCGHEYEKCPTNFLSKECRCPKCSKQISSERYKRKGEENFKKEVNKRVGNKYSILSEYINAHTFITMKHNECGNIYSVTPNNFLNGSRCPKCSLKSRINKRTKTTEKFKKEVYDKVGDEYEVLGEYIKNNKPIKMKHNKCGNIYSVKPNNFLNGNRCPECSKKSRIEKQTKNNQDFKNEVYSKVGNEYSVLSEYINNKTHVTIKHNKCGHTYKVTPRDFLTDRRCPKCFGNKKKTTEEFKKEVYEKVGEEYTVLGEYITNDISITMKHNKCGFTYSVRPSSFLSNGSRCPRCKSSKGELAISYFLDKYKINYEHNKAYGDCSYDAPLRFDFLIFDKNNNLKLICEFDGIQHFKPIDIFGGEGELKETQIRDNIKNEFCKENNIPLLRIPYWEIDNIHKILGKKLYKLDLISNK